MAQRATASFAFLFLDVDGYCAGGVDQRRVVAPSADGYRAREMGWASYAPGAAGHSTGSVYFRDATVAPLAAGDPGVRYVARLHGLPVRPAAGDYGGEPVLCASRLLDAIRAVHGAVAAAAGLPPGRVAVVHKGGNEGYWAHLALGDVPDLQTIDLGLHGCPTVDALGREAPHRHLGRQCRFHARAKRRTRGVVHCPRLELELLADWVARAARGPPREEATPGPPLSGAGPPRLALRELWPRFASHGALGHWPRVARARPSARCAPWPPVPPGLRSGGA